MNFLSAMFDARDSSVELHDVAGAALIIGFLAAAGSAVYHGQPVNLQDFGTGGAALIGGIGAAGWMKGRQRAIDPACKEGQNAS